MFFVVIRLSYILAPGMEQQLLQLTYNLASIDDAVLRFWEILQQYKIFAFSGEMSAGKTTFIHHLCEYLNVEDTVSSPTFSLINEYHFSQQGNDATIYHMDWYRLKNAEEALNAGIEDCLLQTQQKNVYCFVEWPEKAEQILPCPYLWLSIETTSPNERSMSVSIVK